MNIWVVSTLEILWIMVLWVYVCRFLCEHVFSCLLSIYLWVEWLDHMVTLCLNFWGIFKLLSKMTTYQWYKTALQNDYISVIYEGSNFSTPFPTFAITCGFYFLFFLLQLLSMGSHRVRHDWSDLAAAAAAAVNVTWHLMWFPYTFKYSYYGDSWAISPLKAFAFTVPWVHPSLVANLRKKPLIYSFI